MAGADAGPSAAAVVRPHRARRARTDVPAGAGDQRRVPQSRARERAADAPAAAGARRPTRRADAVAAAGTTENPAAKSMLESLMMLWPFYTATVAIVLSFWLGEQRERRLLMRHGLMMPPTRTT